VVLREWAREIHAVGHTDVCQVSDKNKNKTKKQVPPDIPADPATKKKQIPPDFLSGGSSKTRSAGFLITAEFRRVQQQKQTKNKFHRIFRRIQQQKNKKKQVPPNFLSGGSSKTSSAGFFITVEFRRIQQQKQNKNKFRRIFRRNSGRSSNKNKTKTSSAGYSGRSSNKNKTKTSSAGYSGEIPANPATKTKQKNKFRRTFRRIQQQKNKNKFRRIFYPADPARQVPPDF
jgi:hypothetical protein